MRGAWPVFTLLVLGQFSIVGQAETTGQKAQKALAEIDAGDGKAILVLGSLGDRSFVPFLRKIYLKRNEEERVFGDETSYAQMALAKLGQRQQLDEIINELESPGPLIAWHATEKLAYVGGKKAIQALIKQLDKTEIHVASAHVVFSPLCEGAMEALAQIVPHPPIPPGRRTSAEDIPLWKKWWKDVGSKL